MCNTIIHKEIFSCFRKKILFFSILIILCSNQTIFSQILNSTSAFGNSSTNSSTFSTVTGASVTIDVTGVNSLLVISTFQMEMTSPGTDIREASFRIVDIADPENINSGIIRRSLSNSKSTDFGIGSLVYIFDVSALSGYRTYEFQHSFSTAARTVTTSPNIVAIALTDGTEQLQCIVKRVSTPSTMTSSWGAVSGSETDIISTTDPGGFYVAASIESMTSSFNTSSVAQWKLQYKVGTDGTWSDLSSAVQRSMSNSNDRGIINLVGMLPDSTIAGDYYFRIAHRRISPSSTINTEAANIVAVSLATTNGSFSIFKLTGSGVSTTSSSMSDAISTKVITSLNTALILHAQYSMSADAETNSSTYDIYVDNSMLDSPDQKRYISSSSDVGSGSSVAATGDLIAGIEYNVSLRHASASNNTLTSNDMSLIGFGLTLNSGPLPIELKYFKANCIDNSNAIIEWATVSERNNDYFTIYKSNDCNNWIEIGTIMGAGNSNRLLNYEFVDKLANSNKTTYYQLKQTDYNGKSTEFDMVSKNCGLHLENILIYPNPTREFINLWLNDNTITNEIEITLYNTHGQLCFKKEYLCINNENTFKINLPNSLNQGTYFLKAKNGKDFIYTGLISIHN